MLKIGILGAAGSGKTTLAQFLAVEFGEPKATIHPLMFPLKRFARKLGWDGRKDEKGRRLLQLLGTECGRRCISEDIWIDKWLREADTFELEFGKSVFIADDVRFENEAKAMDITIKVTGRSLDLGANQMHESEHLIWVPTYKVDNSIDGLWNLDAQAVRIVEEVQANASRH